MFRGCALRALLVQGALRPSIQAALPRIWNIVAFSSTALRAQQSVPTAIEEAAEPPTAARLPLSVQAIYYKPLHRQPQHGLPVCNLMLRSYSVRQLEAQCDFALRAAYYLNMPATGIISLPKKIERWTVPRSNFVHKKSQENYERITHKRLIQIMDTSPEVVELWLAFLKKHAVYGVGMKANVWAFEEVGVGKKMNVSLDNLHDVKRPTWAHFGPRKTVETAAMVKDILESEKYKVPETQAPDAMGHYATAEQPAFLPEVRRKPKGVPGIGQDMTNEERRFRELELGVAQTHAKDYLNQAMGGQRVAEEKLAETREAQMMEPQAPTAPKVEPRLEEPEPRRTEAEQLRSEVDRVRDLELKKALEAKEAAEARAAESQKRTIEFQTSLLAQLAAMQAELAAMKAAQATPPPAPEAKPVEAKPQVEAPLVATEEVPTPEPVVSETSTIVFDTAAAGIASKQPTEQIQPKSFEAAPAEAAPSEAAPSEAVPSEVAPSEAAPVEPTPASVIPEPIPSHTTDQPASELIAAPEALVIDTATATSPAPEPPTAEQLTPTSPSPTSAPPEPLEAIAEKVAEDTLLVAAAEELEPVPYETAETVVESSGSVESPEVIIEDIRAVELAEEPGKVEEILQAQEPAEPVVAVGSQEAQPKRQDEYQPELQIVNEEAAMDEVPTEATETPDVPKRQPEITRDEEPSKEKQEKPEEVKDEEQPR